MRYAPAELRICAARDGFVGPQLPARLHVDRRIDLPINQPTSPPAAARERLAGESQKELKLS